MKTKMLIWLLMLIQFGSKAQSINSAELDNLFSSIEKNDKGMGCISLFENGHEVYHHVFGLANIKNKIKATKETEYRIGSVTKTFTATAIMQLMEEQKLSLATKLVEFFPNIPHAKQITIAQLLRHRSGLTDQNYLRWEYYGRAYSLKTKAEYANVNYVLLAQIAEKIENKPFSEILSIRIFAPCQLQHTFYGYKGNSSINKEASSYRRKTGWQLVTPSDLSEPHGAGGIISTSSDVNTFFYCLFAGKLVSEKSLQEMNKTVDGYGIGMMPLQYKDKIAFGHSGGIDGFQSTVSFFPDTNFSIAYISNGVAMPVNDILVAALKIYFE